MRFKLREDITKIFIVLVLVILSFLIIFYSELVLKSNILITFFFYFPSILACLWWKKKGMVIPVILSTVLIAIHLIIGYNNFILEFCNDIINTISLIFIGFVVLYLSDQLSKREFELKNIIEDLERSNEDLQQFAYVSSHDLQEPLRAIISFSQLLEDDYHDKLDKNGKEFLFFITDGAKKMNTLIKDLLTYSRITTHAKPPNWNNLENILKDALFNLSESIKESNAIITYDKLPTLKVDKTQMLQLFQNFISNGIKFRREETPKIHVGVKKIQFGWLFSIKDNGIGIESKYFDRIYNIFYRLHTKEEYPGTGIGLPICRKIIQRYGGQIWVESELGKGSTFFFTISTENTKKKLKE